MRVKMCFTWEARSFHLFIPLTKIISSYLFSSFLLDLDLVKLSNVSFVINKTHQGKSRIRGSIGSEFTDGLFRLLAIRIIFLPVFGPENTLYLLVSRIQFDGAACDKFVSRVNNPRKHKSKHIGTLLSVFIFID